MSSKPRIAHISGSNATISSSPPLVTSNKAREKRGLHLLEDASGARLRFDALRPQRLAAPVTVYVEQFSAHPLEHDAAELYGPPDGYVDRSGKYSRQRRSESDIPVYEITLSPEDGLYQIGRASCRERVEGEGGAAGVEQRVVEPATRAE